MAEMNLVISTPDLSEAIKELASAIKSASAAKTAIEVSKVGMVIKPTIPEDVIVKAEEPAKVEEPAPAAPEPEKVGKPVTPVEETIPMPAPAPAPAPVEEPKVTTTAKPVTLNDLCTAGAGLVESGKMDEVINLLNKKYGVQAVNQLQVDQYSAFAEDLKALGAKL